MTVFPGNISAPMYMEPDYSGNTLPYFSASTPFSASFVILRTFNGEPFTAAYKVSANLIQHEIVRHFENTTNLTSKNSNVSNGSSFGW